MGPIIDLSILFPWKILMLFAYSFAYFNIVHALLKDKYHPFLTFGSIFGLRVLLSLLRAPFNAESNVDFLFLFLFLALTFVFTLFLTEGPVLKKLTATLFYTISHIFTAFASAIYTSILFKGKDYYALYNLHYPDEELPQIFFANIVLVFSISFLFAGILKLFEAKKSHYIHKKLYAYFSFLPIAHIFFVIVNLIVMPLEDDSEYTTIMQTLFVFIISFILIFDCSFPFIVDHFEKVELEYQENKKELVKSQLNYQQTQFLKEERQEFRKIKHDFLNLTTTAKGFIEIGKPEKALSILNKTNDDLMSSSGFYICSNDTINTILYIKQKRAKEVNVTVSMDIDETALLLIDDYSICRIIHNLMDNAIEAASKTVEKVVSITIKIDQTLFTFECENSFIDTKSENKQRAGHGYGIGIIKEISKKYNGSYTFKKTKSTFFTKVEMKNMKIEK